MNSRQRETLEAIFARPVPADLACSELESLLLAIGARKTEGSGSRVRFEMGSVAVYLHKPHNPAILKRYQIGLVREFVEKAGVLP